MTVRVRFAPSPTGYLHVGGARTALFNYLFAKSCKGSCILRIEDTDQNRLDQNALADITQSLQWLGISFDESPEKGGPHAPYVQSQRLDLYQKAVEQLLEKKLAYPCFCSAERLEEMRQQQVASGKGESGYDRHCLRLTPQQRQERIERGDPYVVRFKIPDGRTISFFDVVRGMINYNSSDLDDFVILKSDGFPTYHLANVVDDNAMNITHVLRGDEWIASTPKHVLLYEALGYGLPHFVHLPIILAPGGGKLSKRHGAVSVMDYRNAGFLAEGLFNFLTLVGWSPGDDREKMTPEEIIAAFSLDRLQAKSAVFDTQKLLWLNGQYMQQRSPQQLFELIVPALEQKSWYRPIRTETVLKIITLLKLRAKTTCELVDMMQYFFQAPVHYDEKTQKKMFKPAAAEVLKDELKLLEELQNNYTAKAIETGITGYIQSTGKSFTKVIGPLRLAVSGVGSGPSLFDILEIIGFNETKQRVQRAITVIESAAEDA